MGLTPGTPSTPTLPPGACDCHMHVYDSRFPALPGATLTPPDATVADYRALQARLKLQRTVVVTPSTYGTDNTSLLDALAQFGGSARGVAVCDAGVSDDQLQALHAAGVRGLRFNQNIGAATQLQDLEPLAERIAAWGWHLQLLLPADTLPAMETHLRALPVPLVFDHLGRLPATGLSHPGFDVICRLLESGQAWVKLSGPYLGGPRVAGRYPQAEALARAYIAIAPQRLLWGSNWPHPTATAGQHEMPDDAHLLQQLARWTDSDTLFTQVLATNPAALYGFAAPN
jgi:predicted TIM-barrel fold metal-dependent hydrolase